MKKFIMILAICAIALTANAQLFVGGNLNLGINGIRERGKDAKGNVEKTADSHTNFNFTIGPRVGYCINEKWAVGGDILLGMGSNPYNGLGASYSEVEFYDGNKNKKSTGSLTNFKWGIYPFARYTFVTYNKFSFGVEGSIGFGGVHSKGKGTTTEPKKTTTKAEFPATFEIQVFNIKPVMSFQLKNHLFLAASLDFLGFGYDIAIQPAKKAGGDQRGNGDVKTTWHKFGLNIQKMTEVTIGVVYQF